mmetsp:Transcript_31259/g.78178  ORF Transcript_31259/g.78178 Transcript_31259/m.78178 type:complete len:207 (+) Transcript_31259:416-1036(+)
MCAGSGCRNRCSGAVMARSDCDVSAGVQIASGRVSWSVTTACSMRTSRCRGVSGTRRVRGSATTLILRESPPIFEESTLPLPLPPTAGDAVTPRERAERLPLPLLPSILSTSTSRSASAKLTAAKSPSVAVRQLASQRRIPLDSSSLAVAPAALASRGASSASGTFSSRARRALSCASVTPESSSCCDFELACLASFSFTSSSRAI